MILKTIYLVEQMNKMESITINNNQPATTLEKVPYDFELDGDYIYRIDHNYLGNANWYSRTAIMDKKTFLKALEKWKDE